jgi:hypothetical protein
MLLAFDRNKYLDTKKVIDDDAKVPTIDNPKPKYAPQSIPAIKVSGEHGKKNIAKNIWEIIKIQGPILG